MASTVFIKADEVAAELGISKSLAYRMIHQWNEELKQKGLYNSNRTGKPPVLP